MLFSGMVAAACIAAAILLRHRSLGLLAIICWVQNLLIPWWYTEGWIDPSAALPLIIVKELILTVTLGYSVWRLSGTKFSELPAPIRAAVVYAVVTMARIIFGVVILGEPLGADVRLIRSILFPPEVLLMSFVAGFVIRDLRLRFERMLIVGLTICAAISLIIFFFAGSEFWRTHINIAAYNVEVKGDPSWTVDLDRGVSGSGLGREAFSWLSNFRLIGTFGDPLTAGFSLAVGLLLLLARRRVQGLSAIAAVILSTAIALTFSRSAWIFVAIAFCYIAMVRRSYRRIVLAAAIVGIAWLALGGLRDFFMVSLSSFDPTSSADTYHAEGLRSFYTNTLTDPHSILGHGPITNTEQTATVENGYLYIVEQFGLVVLAPFIWICASAALYLRRCAWHESAFELAGAAFAIGTLLVFNFSFYALSFTAYFAIWAVIGVAVGSAHRHVLTFRIAERLQVENAFGSTPFLAHQS
jgi:hypothetical protein